MVRPIFPHDTAKVCALAFLEEGIRARTFKRASNPLNYDSKVRPTRSEGTVERLARLGEKPHTAWLWIEHEDTEEAFNKVRELEKKLDVNFSHIGFPQQD